MIGTDDWHGYKAIGCEARVIAASATAPDPRRWRELHENAIEGARGVYHAISAEYLQGYVEVRLPVQTGATRKSRCSGRSSTASRRKIESLPSAVRGRLLQVAQEVGVGVARVLLHVALAASAQSSQAFHGGHAVMIGLAESSGHGNGSGSGSRPSMVAAVHSGSEQPQGSKRPARAPEGQRKRATRKNNSGGGSGNDAPAAPVPPDPMRRMNPAIITLVKSLPEFEDPTEKPEFSQADRDAWFAYAKSHLQLDLLAAAGRLGRWRGG